MQGAGAFRSVFQGRHKSDQGRQVAIKVMRKASHNTAKKRELMEKEIMILKNLTRHRHQNIVSLLDVMTTTNNVYLVMKYYKLGDLSDYMTCVGKMDKGTISLFLRQISTDMSVLQEGNIVHRDLIPQNILLTSKSISTDSQSLKSSSRFLICE